MGASEDAVGLSPAEVARRLNCSAGTVRRWARDGLVPSVRIGPDGPLARVRIGEDDFARLVRPAFRDPRESG